MTGRVFEVRPQFRYKFSGIRIRVDQSADLHAFDRAQGPDMAARSGGSNRIVAHPGAPQADDRGRDHPASSRLARNSSRRTLMLTTS